MTPFSNSGMRQVFIRFYFTVAICFLVAAVLIGAAYKRVVDRGNQRYLSDIFAATISVIESELGDIPNSLWHDEVQRIAGKVPVPVQIDPLDSYILSPVNQKGLLEGDIIMLYEEDLYLHRIHDTGMMVVLGPIPFLARTDRINAEDMLALFLMCLSLGLPAWLWLRPLWQDLLLLSNQGRKLGEGDFGARVDLPQTSALALLGAAFNRMAHDVQELTSSRKAMIDAVSHDLRTPLARLRYRLEIIRGGGDVEATLNAIGRDLNQIDELIEEWLTMNSLDKPEMRVECQPMEIVAWLQHQVGEFNFKSGPVAVINQSGLEYPVMDADSFYLGRALGNLMSNALRYGGEGVVVHLTLTWEGGWATLHVDDSGPGIPESERARLLQPFERLEVSRNRRTGGFGLGLAIVSLVMRTHGGSALIADSPLGGARISLRWPTALRDARPMSA
ncbi:two-component system, OmpR family, sensor histidine kinase RstB [Formivibrio citricus]|uniref:histidine kinase n=1 Tax=Formivibrio citricus TaxID=83765 RepID=A0A1I5CS98_9NEIS|nr:ATP-binding protein [Formivibrio citricus]SFN89859.1 two-component system, OmpR family, sensor histidine kinase RstB [Formivibrio citricus]